jgi:soluble lytic murein transglycosylase-like protein
LRGRSSSPTRLLALAALAAGATISPGRAGEVRFTTGRVLEVTTARADGEQIWLDLPGGGSLAVPRTQVVEIRSAAEPPEPPAPEPAPEAPPVAAAPADRIEPLIQRAAARHGVDPRLVRAVILAESGGDPNAVSPKGAMGLMQLMPATAHARGVADPFDPGENIDAGTAELAAWLDGYAGEIAMALAAYNAGGRAVDRHEGIPPYRETLRYVRQVLDLYFGASPAD